MKKYKNYIFGLYGVLADIHTEENTRDFWTQVARFMGYQGATYGDEELAKKFQEYCVESVQDTLDAEAADPKKAPAEGQESYPEISLIKVFTKLYADKGVKASKDLIAYTGQAFRAASTVRLAKNDGVEDLVADLRKAGAKVYLLTNTQRLFTMPELKLLGLEDSFDEVFISSDYDYRKPDPRFFHAVLKKYKLDPAESLMIGNDPVNDIGGAKNVGMDALYIRNGASAYRPDNMIEAESAGADYILYKMDLNRLRKLLLSAFEE